MSTSLPAVFLFAALFSWTATAAQDAYNEPNYGWRVERGIVYGQAVDYGGFEQELRMDIYKPVCDNNPSRPLFVIAHGGAFLEGDEGVGDVVALCRALASRGAVAASISYRLGYHLKGGNFDPGLICSADLKCLQALDSTEIIRAAYRGMQNAKGAIRFLKARHAIDSTDVDNVFIGGSSAGGFIALYTGFMDEWEKPEACYALPEAPLPSPLFPPNCPRASISRHRPDLGSTAGTLHLGNGYDASVRGVANFMGGMMEDILPGDRKPALYLYHQTDDLVVNCNYARPFASLRQFCELVFLGCTPLFSTWPLVHGSCRIQSMAEAMGSDAPPVYTDIIDNGPPSVFTCFTAGNHSIVDTERRVSNLMGFFSPIIAEHGNTGPEDCPLAFDQDCSGSVANSALWGEAESAYNRAYSLLQLPDGSFLAAGEWEGHGAVFHLNAQGDSLGYERYGSAIGGTSSVLYGLAQLDDGSIVALGECAGCGPEDELGRIVLLKLSADDGSVQQHRMLGKPASCDNCVHENTGGVFLADAERIVVASEVRLGTSTDLNFTVLTHDLEVERSTVANIRVFDRPFAVLPSDGNYLVLANHPGGDFGVSFALFNQYGSLLRSVAPLEGLKGQAAVRSNSHLLVTGRTVTPGGPSHIWVGRFGFPNWQLIDEVRLEAPLDGQGRALALLGPCRALLSAWQSLPNDVGSFRSSLIYRLSWCDTIVVDGPADTIPYPNAFTSNSIEHLVPLDDSGFRYLALGWRGFLDSRSFAHSRHLLPLSGALTLLPPTCAGDADGAITAAVQGVPPLSYTWQGNAATVPSLSNLAAGEYELLITDGACQTLALQAELPDGVEIDTQVDLDEETGAIVAAQAGASYQWIDCGTGQDLPGASAQSFLPGQSGSYAVRISLGGCSLLSDCTAIVSTAGPGEAKLQAQVFPNPNSGKFFLDLPWPAEAALYDIAGRRLSSARYGAGQHELVVDGQAGVYWLLLRHKGGAQTLQLVKF